jgi:uncharacterized protein (TIGR03083 family)
MTGDLAHVAATAAAAQRFSELARTTPHDLPLPHLRRWRVHDVVAHLTGDHAWALGILRTRTAPRSGLRKARERGEALCDRFDAVTADLLAELARAAADPGAPCPNFAQGAQGRAGWWPRHQAHEATVHLWDLEAATGEHAPLDPWLCADGVAELLEVYTARYPGQVLDRPVVLRAPSYAAWRVEPLGHEGRVGIAAVDERTPGDLEATPDVLLLALWHRLPADHPGLRGGTDEAGAAAARAFVAGPLTA